MPEKRYFKEKLKKMWKENLILCFCLYLIGLVRAEGFELGRGANLQMDVGAAKHITICTGLKRYISCRDGSNVAITYAFWGRTSDKVCPSDDGDPVTDCDSADETEDLVKKKCEGKDQCQLEARHQYLQKNGTHHCPGVNKYLRVNYTCIPESKGLVLCDSEESTIECRAGWKIVITDAFWGRRASAKYCGTAENAMECESQGFALKYLKTLCDGTSTCKIKAISDMLDDKRATSCPGLLKYLLVNYACKPMGGIGRERVSLDDENEATVENKLLTDTSSKELMGLLEKHLNELQTAKPYKAKTEALKMESATQSKKLPASAAKQTHHPNKPQNGKPDSQEAANQPSQYLSGNAFVRTIPKDGLNETPAMDIKETDSAKKTQENVPPAAMAAIKHELPKATDDSVTLKHELPKTSDNNVAIKHELPKLSDDNVSTKHEITKASDDTVDESYEVPEPSTVKSILARAKEVLKSLDEDADGSIKKSGITRKTTGDSAQAEKAVKQVATLAQNLVKTANKVTGLKKLQSSSKHPNSSNIQGSKTQQQQQPATSQQLFQESREKKPEPGPKKSGKSATGLGSAGVGNTP